MSIIPTNAAMNTKNKRNEKKTGKPLEEYMKHLLCSSEGVFF